MIPASRRREDIGVVGGEADRRLVGELPEAEPEAARAPDELEGFAEQLGALVRGLIGLLTAAAAQDQHRGTKSAARAIPSTRARRMKAIPSTRRKAIRPERDRERITAKPTVIESARAGSFRAAVRTAVIKRSPSSGGKRTR